MIPDDDILNGGRHPVTNIRYWDARDELRAHSVLVANDMGCREKRALSNGDLLAMVKIASVRDLSREEKRRFLRMDLALEAADEKGDTRYFAVEIDFYAEQDGIHRAIANAQLLARFTGQLASAVIAVGRDYRGLPQAVLNGEYPILLERPSDERVYLYRLNERNIERGMADLRYERWLDSQPK